MGINSKPKTKQPQDTRMKIRIAFEVIRRRILGKNLVILVELLLVLKQMLFI
jgi:hypothetical protein